MGSDNGNDRNFIQEQNKHMDTIIENNSLALHGAVGAGFWEVTDLVSEKL